MAVYSEERPVSLEAACDILVEMEPVTYTLTLDPFDTNSKKSRVRKVLAQTSMFRSVVLTC